MDAAYIEDKNRIDKVQTKPKLISNNFPDRSKFQIVSIVQKTTEIVRVTYVVL